jgi:CheY-like chemotaxis protein
MTQSNRPRTKTKRVQTILVVEDNPDIRDLINEMLDGCPYRILNAANADEGLTVLDGDHTVDLLFTDIIMPGRLNGVDLAQEALRRRPHLKLLFASGYASVAVLAPLRHQMSLTFIKKPYRPHELTRRIAALLGK